MEISENTKNLLKGLKNYLEMQYILENENSWLHKKDNIVNEEFIQTNFDNIIDWLNNLLNVKNEEIQTIINKIINLN